MVSEPFCVLSEAFPKRPQVFPTVPKGLRLTHRTLQVTLFEVSYGAQRSPARAASSMCGKA
jgi:hypothetical protein